MWTVGRTSFRRCGKNYYVETQQRALAFAVAESRGCSEGAMGERDSEWVHRQPWVDKHLRGSRLGGDYSAGRKLKKALLAPGTP